MCAKLWYVCVKLLYVKFVCVSVCEVLVCEYRREEAEGGGARDTESKTRTPHKDRISQRNIFIVEDAWNSIEKNWEKPPFFKSPCSSKIPIFEVSWTDMIERKIWDKSTNHFFQNTLLFTKSHLRSLLDSKPGRKLLLLKTPCSYILEVPWENFDGKTWWKSVFFKTACPGNIFQNTMPSKISDLKSVLERMEFLAMLVHLRNF